MSELSESDRAQAIKAAQEIIAPFKDVVFSYAFGSVTNKAAGPVNDFDLAVYLKRLPQDLNSQLEFEQKLEREFRARLPKLPLDLTILNTAPLGLKAAVFQKGQLLMTSDENVLTNMIERVTLQFLDTAPLTNAYFFDRVS